MKEIIAFLREIGEFAGKVFVQLVIWLAAIVAAVGIASIVFPT